MATTSAAWADVVARENKFYQTAPDVVKVHILPTGERTFVEVAEGTTAGSMVETWPVDWQPSQVRKPKRNTAEHDAMVQHFHLFRSSPPEQHQAKVLRRERHAAEHQQIHLFDKTKDLTTNETTQASCLRPLKKIWDEDEGPRMHRKAAISRRRPRHALSAWWQAEAVDAMNKKFRSRFCNKQMVPLSILHATPHQRKRRKPVGGDVTTKPCTERTPQPPKRVPTPPTSRERVVEGKGAGEAQAEKVLNLRVRKKISNIWQKFFVEDGDDDSDYFRV